MAGSSDVLVLGGGLGGLLAAARCAQAGAHVTVVERLGWLGGRFTTHWHNGFALSSGALHFVPHGASGPLARSLEALGLHGLIEPAHIFGSVRERRRHTLLRRPIDILRLVSPVEAVQMVRQLWALKRGTALSGSFGDWLHQQRSSPRLTDLWRTFTDFALSVSVEDIAAPEMRAVVRNVARLGDPGIARGGCGAIVDALAHFIETHGGTCVLHQDVTAVRPPAVDLTDRRTGRQWTAYAGRIVSDLGPAATARLLGRPEPSSPRPARGLKVHLASSCSHIPHSGIMFCLGTQRISGAVQPTNVNPGLAPANEHLIVAFATLRSANLARERELVLADVRELFGEGPRILAMSAFDTGQWPVNRALQGEDVRDRHTIDGVVLVGDGCKPAGFMMADGVAQSVEQALGAAGLSPRREFGRAGTLVYVRRSLRAA